MKKIFYPAFLLALLAMAFTQQRYRKISGNIKDDAGRPLTGVSITVKNNKASTVTDSIGNFIIQVPDKKEATLYISYVGYTSQEVKITHQTNLSINLKASDMALEEVVVASYSGKRQKKVLGYSTTVIHSKAIEVTDTYNSSPMLSGKMSGVQITGNYKKKASVDNYSVHDSYISDFNREGYDEILENPFLKVTDNPLSTFSIDVDAASYSNIRRYINNGQIPPKGAVRIEEMINYFSYDYPQPENDKPFSINTEVSVCPWNEKHQLVLIGLQGKKIPYESLPASNLTFLIDVSGSMSDENKLPLVKASLKLLIDQLREQDRISIVVYAGNAGLVLAPTNGNNKQTIKEAIDRLESGGSTAGGAGIQLAYRTAKEYFKKDGNNRVILCTDGDFNVGVSSDDALINLIEKERESGIFLTVLGYGMGNYQDAKMQKLADKGNGNHAYIDNLSEAKKVLVNEFGGTLFTIAKDVKLQIEFNPQHIKGYRLIGYENRILAKEDFNNDQKDAGEMGSGNTVTALYEIIPANISAPELDSVDALRYQQNKPKKINTFSGEWMNVKFRYKEPLGNTSSLIQQQVYATKKSIQESSNNLRFASAVAQFGMLLRNSNYKGNSSYQKVFDLATGAKAKDTGGYKAGFLQLVEQAALLAVQPIAKQK
jgi:Ca-activated chloride channel homolog